MINNAQEGPAKRRRSRAERGAEIESAARSIALAEGLAAVTLRGVAQAIGVAPSLVAHYEPSMDELVARTFTAIAAQEMLDVTAIVRAERVPTDALGALLDAVRDPSREDVGALWSDAWSIGRRNPPLAAAARNTMDAWQALAADVVRAGVAAGEFTAADPEAVGLLLFALVDATNAYALVGYRDGAERDRLLRRAVEQAVTVPPGRFA